MWTLHRSLRLCAFRHPKCLGMVDALYMILYLMLEVLQAVYNKQVGEDN